MKPNIESNASSPLAASPRRIARAEDEGSRAARLAAKIEAFRQGELAGKRDTLLRLVARAGLVFDEEDLRSIRACTHLATLDRWLDQIAGARSTAEVLSRPTPDR
jgi:hypothetical protein